MGLSSNPVWVKFWHKLLATYGGCSIAQLCLCSGAEMCLATFSFFYEITKLELDANYIFMKSRIARVITESNFSSRAKIFMLDIFYACSNAFE